MNETTPELGPKRGSRWGWLIIGSIIFGILMAVRGEFDSMLTRAAVAACAGAVLGLAIAQMRKQN